jgi:transcriptional regulator with XRE-family HTH domain
LRQAAGLGQRQLARAAGVPLGTLQCWDQARRIPSFKAAIKLAKALGVSLDRLADLAK